MKITLLKLSGLLNLVMAGILVYTLVHRPNPAPVTAGVTVPAPAPAPAVVGASPVTSRPEPIPFCWARLASKDYPSYVHNLRAAGCPELSVRAIVTADVHAVIAKRYDALNQKLAALADASWSVQLGALNTEKALATERQLLPAAEAAEINELLGLKPAPAETPVLADSAPPAVDNSQPSVALPLAFQTIDPAALNLTSDQISVINDIRQSFMKDIGGENQNPDDPAYMDRWQKAQPAADDMLRLMLGTTFFQNYQMAALGHAP